MIKLEHVVLASPEQMDFIIEGMRNPMNSWGNSDSMLCGSRTCLNCCERDGCLFDHNPNKPFIGPNDHNRMFGLAKAGTDHRKYMRMMPVYVRITAPLYWWKEFDTYKVGTVSNSCSTMHKITDKEFTLSDFSWENLGGRCLNSLETIIDDLNYYRDKYIEIDYMIKNYNGEDSLDALKRARKNCWWNLIQLLPSSYNQTRNIMMNYEVLANIYKSRKNHKVDEWRTVCKWIKTLPYSEIVTLEEAEET